MFLLNYNLFSRFEDFNFKLVCMEKKPKYPDLEDFSKFLSKMKTSKRHSLAHVT